MARAIGIALIAIGVVLMLFGRCARADEIWLTATTASHHFSSEKFNERNPGLGLEYEIKPKLRAIGGEYLNSLSRHSSYFGAMWTPVRLLGVDLGGTLGMVNGYPLNDGRYFPAGTLVAMYERERAGINLQYIPGIPATTPAVLALQLKVRF